MVRIGVAIADDHAILRSGLCMLINAQPDMQVVAEVTTVAEVAPALEKSQAQVLLLDISMAGDSGLTALKQLRANRPSTKAIILTMHKDLAVLRSALAQGAAGFVLKQAAANDLLSAIRAVHKGGMFIDPSLVAAVMEDKLNPPAREVLSRREKEVVQLIAQGYGNQEVAGWLYISVKTVETYKARIAEKLGLHSRNEITRYALLSGLLRPEDFPQDKSAA